METEKKGLMASTIGNRLQMEFFKLFSGEIQETERISNEPTLEPVEEKTERFLDRN